MSYLSDLLGGAYTEGMSEEDISEALSNVMKGKEESGSAELTKLKNALSKANSEAADYKKQLRAKMSEDEAAAVAKQEEIDKILKENADLKRNMALSERQTKLLAMGYDEKLALSTAEAMVDGDMETVMANQAKYLEAQKKEILADKMKSTPRPGGGAESGGGLDYSSEIATARANGDLSAVAYYMRLSQQMGESE